MTISKLTPGDYDQLWEIFSEVIQPGKGFVHKELGLADTYILFKRL